METGLSNFYRITVSILKMHFRKLSPKILTYRDFKTFENETFMDSLKIRKRKEKKVPPWE